jgi:hypothetical protein
MLAVAVEPGAVGTVPTGSGKVQQGAAEPAMCCSAGRMCCSAGRGVVAQQEKHARNQDMRFSFAQPVQSGPARLATAWPALH